MAKGEKAEPPINAPAESITEFEVTGRGTLRMANYAEAKTRADFYQDVADGWDGSSQDLADAMDACQPLAWAVHTLYTDFREELEAAIESAQDENQPSRRKIAALKAKLKEMPEEPFDGASEWLLRLTTTEFETRIVPSIQTWFSEPPDWSFEDEYLTESGTAQGAALEFFRSMDTDAMDLLGVDIVEGEHPGSTYYAAELRGDIDVANRAADAAGMRVRFVKG